ncbi:hypothetical protein G5714_023009 [Onychostoma macrolepis]|uniref:Uncharacterized protein n=1 Tax=Onychostoma macrolepis TaxID=369639 RepID=A0A7J6BPW5_9TELE|nr:hypothetical protein G5714_023009 [Onychostoma macrolepis]
MLHVCIHLQGGVMERCRLWSEQDISRRLRVDGGRKSRREEEKENEIGESVDSFSESRGCPWHTDWKPLVYEWSWRSARPYGCSASRPTVNPLLPRDQLCSTLNPLLTLYVSLSRILKQFGISIRGIGANAIIKRGAGGEETMKNRFGGEMNAGEWAVPNARGCAPDTQVGSGLFGSCEQRMYPHFSLSQHLCHSVWVTDSDEQKTSFAGG